MGRRSKRVLNGFLSAAAVLLVLPAVGFGLHVYHLGYSAMRLAAAVAVCSLAAAAVVAVLLPVGTWKTRLALVVWTVLVVEAVLQVVALGGWLPGISTVGTVPYGRVYWTQEGASTNGLMNRFGWHAPPFDLSGSGRRIAVIGDSMVEGLQVPRSRTMGAALQQHFDRAGGDNVQVFSLGVSGASAGHYLELLRYSHETLGASEAIIVVHLGNDLADMLPETNSNDPSQCIVYRRDPSGRLGLTPQGQAAGECLRRGLRWNHAPLVFNLPRTARTHLLIARVVKQVAQVARAAGRGAPQPTTIRERFEATGLLDFVFRKDRPPEALLATEAMLDALDRCTAYARENGISLRIVTLPKWPLELYDANAGKPWTARIDAYDFLLPDRDLLAWARQAGVPAVSLGNVMAEQSLDSATIRGFFLVNGTGHPSPAGHQWIADVMFAALHPQAKKLQR